MSDVDVARIVPSTRNLQHATSTRRRGVALICRLRPAAAAEQAHRLDALDVRALALHAPGADMLAAATATASLPILSLAPIANIEDAQRARYFGADGAYLVASEHSDDALATLAAAVRSTRMLPLLLIRDVAEFARPAVSRARALIWQNDDAAPLAALAIARNTLLIAWPSTTTPAQLRQLNGIVDAAILAPELHELADFAQLLDELDS